MEPVALATSVLEFLMESGKWTAFFSYIHFQISYSQISQTNLLELVPKDLRNFDHESNDRRKRIKLNPIVNSRNKS